MSLIVWLPLDGDLRNLGVSDIEVTNNGATVDNAGKIGKCYSFNGNALYGDLSTISNMTQASGCCWVYLTNLNSAQYFFHFGGQSSYPAKFSLDYEGSIRSQINGTEYTSGITLNTNIWYHVAFTWNGSSIKWYINGEEKVSKTTSGAFSASNHFAIGARTNGTAGNTFAYTITNGGKLNDVRIYDHCLSAAEVHEIAQGLVLHYKLDGINNSSFLPTQYQQLEYIESSGTSYFDTGYKFDAEIDECKVIFKGNDTSNTGMIFASSGSKYFWFYYYGSSGIRIYANNGSGQQGITGISSDLNQHTMEFKNKTYYIDGVSKGSLSNSYTETTNNIWLFSYGNNNYPFKGRIYYVEIIKNKIKQRVFIPAKRLTDSAIGMYDLITENFYTSSNTAFTAGTTIGTLTIQDSSGYGHNGTIIGDLMINKETKRYLSSTKWNSSAPAENSETGICYIQAPFSLTNPLHLSFTWWAKPENGYCGVGNSAFCTSSSSTRPTDYNTTAFHHRDSGFDICPSDNTGVKRLSFPYIKNEWHHYAITYDGTTAKAYRDGTLQTSVIVGTNKTLASFSQLFIGYSQAGSVRRKTLGSYNDFRIYCTPLLDKDIKLLYNIGMRVDNLGGIHAFGLEENQPNLMWRPENARAAGLGLNWGEGLGAYTQSNCQVTCDSNGYRIYRPPNLTVANNGNTMWGGLRVRNSTNGSVHTYNASTDNIFGLIKNHTYIFIISVKGQSSNSASMGITNNMGWGGGGLSPSPSNVSANSLGTNFQGEKEIFYKFTITDDIVKTCTSAYSSFVKDSQYLSYMDFTFNFVYASTGTLGTDLYISNICLYDITNVNIKLNKDGILDISSLLENRNAAKIYQSGIIESTEFIEL